MPADSIDDQWDLPGLEAGAGDEFGVQLPIWCRACKPNSEELDADAIAGPRAGRRGRATSREKEAQMGGEIMRMLEKHVMLNVLDQSWKEHLARMDYLRQGIHLRGYAQKQPKQEYKREAFELFSEMLEKVKREVVTLLARVRIRDEDEVAARSRGAPARRARGAQMQFQHPDVGG